MILENKLNSLCLFVRQFVRNAIVEMWFYRLLFKMLLLVELPLTRAPSKQFIWSVSQNFGFWFCTTSLSNFIYLYCLFYLLYNSLCPFVHPLFFLCFTCKYIRNPKSIIIYLMNKFYKYWNNLTMVVFRPTHTKSKYKVFQSNRMLFCLSTNI